MVALRISAFFLRTGTIVMIILFLLFYLVIILLTNYSLTGFWTDVVFSMLLSSFVLLLVLKKMMKAPWRIVLLRTLIIIGFFAVFNLIALSLTNPFSFDLIKLRSFYFQKVEGRTFNAYFKPVGAYAGGQGNIWITESPIYFQLIEKRVYYERGVHHDFTDDYWEGKPIDNYEVVRAYIKDEVIDKGK
jgi:hypothetical protein